MLGMSSHSAAYTRIPRAARDDECDGACGRYRTGACRNMGSACGFVAVAQHLEGH